MSSNIQVQRVCQHCGKEFTARTTVTKYCGDDCAKRAYKARQRAAKIEVSNTETQLIKTKSIEELKAKPFLSITDVFMPNAAQCLSLFRYDENGNRLDNITDWGFNQFVKQYGKKGMSKETIFHYTYAVLHNPAYRKKYELNLKREFPRIPFYKDFAKWANWGKALMDLHINYEQVKAFALIEVIDKEIENPKCKLKADKINGTIILDTATQLTSVPKTAWEYKLGNRSALEWVLDQHKEKKNSDPTIAEKFNTYHFADYKDQVIDLLKRVCTVSVETMNIINQMKKESE